MRQRRRNVDDWIVESNSFCGPRESLLRSWDFPVSVACKEPRTHLKRWPALFQASFASLVQQQSAQVEAQHGHGAGGWTGGCGTGRVRGRVWDAFEAGRPGPNDTKGAEGGGSDGERSSKYSKRQDRGGKGPYWSSGSGWNPKNQSWNNSTEKNKWGGETEAGMDVPSSRPWSG